MSEVANASVRRRLLLWGAVAIALVTTLAVAFWPRAVEVELATVDRGTVREELVDEGRTRMEEVYEISAPVAGRLLRVTVEPGDAVRAGQVVARMARGATGFIDARAEAEARAAVAAAEARRVAAVADRELAAAEARRIERLAADRLVPLSALDQARARLRSAQAVEAAAAASERQSRSALLAAGSGADGASFRGAGGDQVALVSPTDGVVLRVPRESEAVVAAGTPVVVVGDPAGIEVVAEFLSQDAVRLSAGAAARIEGWGGEPVAAVVHRVEPAARTKVSALGIEEQRANVVLRFKGAPPAPLRAQDYRVDVRVLVDEARDAVRVPLGALFRQGSGWAVYVLEGDKVRARQVRVSVADERFRAVVAGLAEGDRVVLFPSASVQEGVRVKAAGPNIGAG